MTKLMRILQRTPHGVALLTAIVLALVAWRSIATARTLYDDTCDPNDPTLIQACPDPPSGGGFGAPTGGLVVPGFTTLESCYTTVGDADLDGVNDACELAIASAFAPMLYQSSSEADFDWSRSLIGGEYYWGVTKSQAWFGLPGLRIAYLPAWYEDEGTGAFDIQGGHDGDSEFLMVDVTFFQGKWSFTRAFTSAHCGVTGFQANCQWWNADMWGNQGAFTFVDYVMFGAPVVWVSHRKHAFYYSHSQCEGAQLGAEGCGAPIVANRFPVTDGFNVGSAAVKWNMWVYGRRGSSWPAPGYGENMWSMNQFRGWRPMPWTGPDNPTGYGKILQDFQF